MKNEIKRERQVEEEKEGKICVYRLKENTRENIKEQGGDAI